MNELIFLFVLIRDVFNLYTAVEFLTKFYPYAFLK